MSVRFIPQSKLVRCIAIGSFLLSTAVSISSASALQAQSVVGGWLRIQRLSGSVTTLTGRRKTSQVGDYLSAVGHGLTTGTRSSATLGVDDGIGSIAVAQNTHITVQELAVLADGARVTVLDVPRGQARLQVRRFTNPNSRLELHTPSGIAAVRGTVFGVSVNEKGKTNIATLEGQVEAIAQNVSVAVNPGEVSIIRPGEPPTPARDLDRKLDIRWHSYEWRNDHLHVAGWIDKANTLSIQGEEVLINRAGYFAEKIPLSARSQRVILTVNNAMGETRRHQLFPWLSYDEK